MRTIIPSNAKLIPKHAQCVFRGLIFDTYQWQQEMFDGRSQTFEMLKRADTVKVILMDGEEVVIVKQEQPGTMVFLDLPGGRHDIKEETELDAAKRELREETGYRCNKWKLVSIVQPDSKIDFLVYYFVAWDIFSASKAQLDNGERIELVKVSFEELKASILAEKFRTPKLNWITKLGTPHDLKSQPCLLSRNRC